MSMNPIAQVPAKNTATASPGIPNAVKVLTHQYMELHREYTRRTEELSQIRDAKRQSEQQLINAITQSGLSGYGITYQGNKLTLGQDTTYDTLTYKFLEDCMAKLYNGDTEKVRKVIGFIKKQRIQHKAQVIKIGWPAVSRSLPNTV